MTWAGHASAFAVKKKKKTGSELLFSMMKMKNFI